MDAASDTTPQPSPRPQRRPGPTAPTASAAPTRPRTGTPADRVAALSAARSAVRSADERAAGGAPGQLRLLEPPAAGEWRLDESTREVGRRGIQLARQALEAARRRDAERAEHDDGPGAHPGSRAGTSTAA